MTPIQAAQTQNWRCSSSQEIKKKRKAETPFSSYIYIITEIKGSTIYAKRVNGGKTICRDASKVILLRTAKEAPARRPTVPPAAPTQARKPTQMTEPEPTTQPNPPPPSLDKGDTAAIQTAMEQQASTEQTQPVTCKS